MESRGSLKDAGHAQENASILASARAFHLSGKAKTARPEEPQMTDRIFNQSQLHGAPDDRHRIRATADD